MKLFLILVLSSVILFGQANDDSKYINAMKKSIILLDSAKGPQDFIYAANGFERIANVEKEKWLPYYYAGFANLILAFTEQDNDKKDMIIDKADEFINKADSLIKNNSEIITLQAFSAEARLTVNPMARYMKYGAIFSNKIEEAIKADSTNPRPYYLRAEMTLNTPEQFGGGLKASMPDFEKALALYESFKPESEIHPVWGKDRVIEILNNTKTTN